MSKKLAVVEPDGERKVFHLLHGEQPGVVKAHRVHRAGSCGKGAPTKDIAFVMPDDGREVRLEIDPRDQRTLIVFDGLLLPNGLPHGSEILRKETLVQPRVPWGRAYKTRDTDPIAFTCAFPPKQHKPFIVEGETMWGIPGQSIQRFFVLMKSRTAAFVRFDHNRLAPYYVLAKVDKDGPAATVTWISSSRM